MESSDMLLGNLLESIFKRVNGTRRCRMYLDASGKATQILPDMNFDNQELYVAIENVNYTGQYVFYDLYYQKENEQITYWKDYYDSVRREAYVYNTETGETRFLCSTD